MKLRPARCTHDHASAGRRPHRDPDRGRRSRGVPRGRPRPAAAVRRAAPDRPRRVRRGGPGRATADEAARRPGRGDPGRLPDAADERHRVPRAGDGRLPVRPAGAADRVRGHQTPRSTRSTSSTSTTTCSSRGTRRRRSSTRSSTTCCAPGGGRNASRCTGPSWSGTAGRRRRTEVRDFLARNQVPYRWYPPTSRRGSGCWPRPGADGRDLPVLITADGEAMIAPSDAEVWPPGWAWRPPPQRDFYDLVVVGGGPAGLGAAVYGASEGLRTVLVEKTATGGQAGQSSRIENYLGFPDGVSGGQLTDRARRQAVKFGAELLTTREVTGLEVNGSARTVRFADGSAIDAQGDHPGHRGLLPAARRARLRRDDGPRRLLRRGADRGRGVQGPGRLHRRRGELGRAGRGVPVPARPVGDHAGARRRRWSSRCRTT